MGKHHIRLFVETYLNVISFRENTCQFSIFFKDESNVGTSAGNFIHDISDDIGCLCTVVSTTSTSDIKDAVHGARKAKALGSNDVRFTKRHHLFGINWLPNHFQFGFLFFNRQRSIASCSSLRSGATCCRCLECDGSRRSVWERLGGPAASKQQRRRKCSLESHGSINNWSQLWFCCNSKDVSSSLMGGVRKLTSRSIGYSISLPPLSRRISIPKMMRLVRTKHVIGQILCCVTNPIGQQPSSIENHTKNPTSSHDICT